jgi:hypothetical protein
MDFEAGKQANRQRAMGNSKCADMGKQKKKSYRAPPQYLVNAEPATKNEPKYWLLGMLTKLLACFAVVDVTCSTIKRISDVYVGTAGGYEIKISGSGFQPNFGAVPKVIIGDDTCDVISYRSSDTQIVCRLPPRPNLVADTDRFSTSQVKVVSGGEQAVCLYNYENKPCPLIFDPHRTTNVSDVMTPTVVTGEVIRLKGRRLNPISSINYAKIGDHQCQLYNESTDDPFESSYYNFECLVPEGMPSGTHNISISTSYSGGGDTLFLPTAWHVNHRTGSLGMIDVAAVTESVEPSMGSLAGGTELVLTGQSYTGEVEVRVGGTPCRVTSHSDDEVRCKLGYRPDALTMHASTGTGVYAKAAMFQRSTRSYATVEVGAEGFAKDEVTVDFWLKAICRHCSIVSYVMEDGTLPLDIRIWNSVLWINVHGSSVYTGDTLADGAWHHVAISWRSVDGMLRVTIDSKGEYSWHSDGGVARSKSFKTNGTIVAGNLVKNWALKQFHYPLLGSLDGLRIWRKSISHAELARTARAAGSAPTSGDALFIHHTSLRMADVLYWFQFDSAGGKGGTVSANNSATNKQTYGRALTLVNVDTAPGIAAEMGSGKQMEQMADGYWSAYTSTLVPSPKASPFAAAKASAEAVATAEATTTVDFEGFPPRNLGFHRATGTVSDVLTPYASVDSLYNRGGPLFRGWRPEPRGAPPPAYIMKPIGMNATTTTRVTASASVSSARLVGEYGFGSGGSVGAGATKVLDSSGAAGGATNSLAIYGGASVANANGSAECLNFDGVNDYAVLNLTRTSSGSSTPSSATLALAQMKSMSLELWFARDADPSTAHKYPYVANRDQRLFEMGNSDDPHYGVHYHAYMSLRLENSDRLQFRIHSGLGGVADFYLSANVYPADPSLHHAFVSISFPELGDYSSTAYTFTATNGESCGSGNDLDCKAYSSIEALREACATDPGAFNPLLLNLLTLPLRPCTAVPSRPFPSSL